LLFCFEILRWQIRWHLSFSWEILNSSTILYSGAWIYQLGVVSLLASRYEEGIYFITVEALEDGRLMNHSALKARFSGALIGTAVGDALGKPLEGSGSVPPEQVAEIARKQTMLRYTDDTHMMLGVAESLAEKGDFDGEHMIHRFIANYEQEPWRGYGPGPVRIFRMVKAGFSWDQVVEILYQQGSYGNGAAMRIAPVGVFYHDDLENLRRVAFASSRLTHGHELGTEGAVLQAAAIALAVRENPAVPLDPRPFLTRLRGFVRSEIYHRKLARISDLLVLKPEQAAIVVELGNGVEAFSSVPTAIYSFLSHPRDFEAAVLYAVGLGGDADTIGAMTGAICGAYQGIENIPPEWKQKLENREYIEKLAEKLWRRKFSL
jgi:poly(ADP-ribose) glycohydrolase ARH3